MTTKTETIRTLNDELRQNLTVGTALITVGVAALGAEAVARIVKTIAVLRRFLPRQ
jgi:stage V sporulation protein SpoVS